MNGFRCLVPKKVRVLPTCAIPLLYSGISRTLDFHSTVCRFVNVSLTFLIHPPAQKIIMSTDVQALEKHLATRAYLDG